MKHLLSLLTVMFLFASCSQSDPDIMENPLLSSWQLHATLTDPGDGSGVFNEVESDRTLSFYDNGEVVSKGSLCEWSTNNLTTITYLYDATAMVIKSECSNHNETLSYDIEGEELIIDYKCIEPCMMKYIKIN